MTPSEMRDMHRRQIDEHGEDVVFRRYSGTGGSRTYQDVTAKARVTGYTPQQLAGTIQQGDLKIIAMAEDLDFAPFVSEPLRSGDKAVVRGSEKNIEGVDSNTRRIAGTLIAYELQVRG